MSASNHEYSEGEADAILKRAIDLQAAQESSKHKVELGRGLTLEQLYRSAAEIGVDPSLVRRAAEEMMGREIVSPKADPRVPTVIERDFLTPITEADFPSLLEHLRDTTKSSGAAQVIGGTLEWHSALMPNREMIHVVVTPSIASTNIRIRSTNVLAHLPARSQYLVLPLVILLLGFIPLLFLGGRYLTEFFPLAFVVVFAGLVSPALFFGRLSRFRSGGSKANQVMESVGEWLRTRAL